MIRIITIILLGLLLAGCTTYNKCKEKFGNTIYDTMVVHFNKLIPADSVQLEAFLDSLEKIPEDQPIVIKQGRASLTLERKPKKRLSIKAKCDTVVIRDTIYVPVQKVVFKDIPNPVTEERKGFWNKVKGFWGSFVFHTLFPIILILILIIIILFKRK